MWMKSKRNAMFHNGELDKLKATANLDNVCIRNIIFERESVLNRDYSNYWEF